MSEAETNRVESNMRALGAIPPEQKEVPSKREWLAKAKSVQRLPMQIDYGQIIAGEKALFSAVGEPTTSEVDGENVCLVWECRDGTVMITGRNPGLSQGILAGDVSLRYLKPMSATASVRRSTWAPAFTRTKP